MNISVVIPARNAEPWIAGQLDTLVDQTFDGPFDVVVVDNGSTDGTAAVAARYADRLDLRVIPATDQAGVTYSRNLGARAARGDLIVFIDADDRSDSGLLAAYARYGGDYEVMGGKVEEKSLNDADVAGWRYELTHDSLPLAFRKYPFFIGCNCAISRRAFDELGGFDESRHYGGEEIDLCIRASLAGYEIGWVPDAIVHYRHRTTLKGLARQFFAYGRADVQYFSRYRELGSLRPTGFLDTLRRFWPLLSRFRTLFQGRRQVGHYVRHASYTAGTLYESIRSRVWYLGG